MDPFIGYDEDSMDSETSSMASFRTDRTPATPDDDLDEVSFSTSLVFCDIVTKTFLEGGSKSNSLLSPLQIAQDDLTTVTSFETTLDFVIRKN